MDQETTDEADEAHEALSAAIKAIRESSRAVLPSGVDLTYNCRHCGQSNVLDEQTIRPAATWARLGVRCSVCGRLNEMCRAYVAKLPVNGGV